MKSFKDTSANSYNRHCSINSAMLFNISFAVLYIDLPFCRVVDFTAIYGIAERFAGFIRRDSGYRSPGAALIHYHSVMHYFFKCGL